MSKSPSDALGEVVRLMGASPIHARWAVSSVLRLVEPPLRLGQCALVREEGCLVGWGAWALLDEGAELGFVSGVRQIQPSDWNAGNRPWLIDVIAPWGHARAVTGQVRQALRDAGYRGRTIRFRRNKGGPRRYSGVVL